MDISRWILKNDEKFRYQILSRLIVDCDYYLGYGGRCTKHLWADNEKEQIEYIKAIWNSFSESQKPEWITWKQILEYEKQIL